MFLSVCPHPPVGKKLQMQEIFFPFSNPISYRIVATFLLIPHRLPSRRVNTAFPESRRPGHDPCAGAGGPRPRHVLSRYCNALRKPARCPLHPSSLHHRCYHAAVSNSCVFQFQHQRTSPSLKWKTFFLMNYL